MPSDDKTQSANENKHQDKHNHSSDAGTRRRLRSTRTCPEKRIQPRRNRRDIAIDSTRRPRSIHGRPRRGHRPRRQLPVLESIEVCFCMEPGRRIAQLHPVAAKTGQRHISGQPRRILEIRRRRQSGYKRVAALLLLGRSDDFRRGQHLNDVDQPLRNVIRRRLFPQAIRKILHGRSVPLHLFRPGLLRLIRRRPDHRRIGILRRHSRLLHHLSRHRPQRMPVVMGMEHFKHRHKSSIQQRRESRIPPYKPSTRNNIHVPSGRLPHSGAQPRP